MMFRNPQNGHIENKEAPWFLTLIFGGLYFLASGLFGHAFVWLILLFLAFSVAGIFGIVLAAILNFVYALAANEIVRGSYLRKGWTEVKGDERAASAPKAAPVPASATHRKCPFCAEEILVEAIKCKHCGSEIPAAAQPSPPAA